MFRFSLLGSGSSGNATLIETDAGAILIDCGLSFKQLALRVERVGLSLDELKAVFITHEHGDHVNGAGVLARRMDVPVYMTDRTRECLPKGVGKLPRIECFESGGLIELAGFEVQSFRVAHDAADPVSFAVRHAGTQLGFATDLGSASHLVRQRLQGSHALILESNYCPQMLRQSPYPAAVVQRIGSRHGHLSNPDMNSLLSDLMHDALRIVVAVHISQENNTVEKAREMAARVLRGHDAELYIAQQDEPSPVFEIEHADTAGLRETG